MDIRFHPIPTQTARAWRNGAPDDYGNPPERVRANGKANPCRHCLHSIPDGAEMLIVAHSPFGARQPYAETGPIFLCADDCTPYDPVRGVPPIFAGNSMLIRAYGNDERILYGTGEVVAPEQLAEECAARLARDDVAFVHVRSATNTCFQARVDRSE